MKPWQVFSLAGLFLASITVLPGFAQAQYFGRGIDQREAAQQQRIQRGVHSGAITPQEARQLAGEQRRIQYAEDRMRADGRLNSQERAHLDRMQDKADRNIFRQKHDYQAAHPGYRYHHEPRRGPHYASRHHGPYPKAACRPNHGDRGRSFQPHYRDRRLAWHR